MIECIFTLDYEIYGNGAGSLKDLVYEPASRLIGLFHRWDARFVAFVEAAELDRIEACGADPHIDLVKTQVRDLDRAGFEIGLHLHPQWCNASRVGGRWVLDYSEYNLCTLSAPRISAIVSGALGYLRCLVSRSHFTPLSFRAGNWLFQPTAPAASILAGYGIGLDSSVFRGGLQRNHGLDYRGAPRDAYYWPFRADVTVPDPAGAWIEVPIHTEMVPSWRIPAAKRLALGNSFGGAGQSPIRRLNRALDFLRFRYPLKLDFCRMTAGQMAAMVARVIEKDRCEPGISRPIVAIGHTKDLSDIGAVDAFLAFLKANGIAVTTFRDVYPKLLQETQQAAAISGHGHEVGTTLAS